MIESLFVARNFGPVSLVVTSTLGGFSTGSYESFNLANYVGDDPLAVARNQDLLVKHLQATDLKVLAANHGNQVQVVDANSTVSPGDGLVTKSANVALVALAADCATFGLIDPVSNVLAVGHCGWKGLVNRLPEAVVREFAKQGGNCSRSLAVIGPTICAHCYQVAADRVAQVWQICPAAVASETNLDIGAGVNTTLGNFGFKVEQISACTFETSNLYSFRRNNLTGRHALALIRTESED